MTQNMPIIMPHPNSQTPNHMQQPSGNGTRCGPTKHKRDNSYTIRTCVLNCSLPNKRVAKGSDLPSAFAAKSLQTKCNISPSSHPLHHNYITHHHYITSSLHHILHHHAFLLHIITSPLHQHCISNVYSNDYGDVMVM